MESHRGVADDYFLLYLKELKYRFNRRKLNQEKFAKQLLRVLSREPQDSQYDLSDAYAGHAFADY